MTSHFRSGQPGCGKSQRSRNGPSRKSSSRVGPRSTQALSRGGANATADGRVSSSGGGDTEHEFRVHVASFPAVEELTRENRGKFLDVKLLLGKPAADAVRLGTELTDREKLRELDRLVAMAKTLGEMTVSELSDFSVRDNIGGSGLRVDSFVE